MDASLNAVEVRILGALIEKQKTTPEYYPLTLNALVNACNQTTNRDPITSYDEGTVARTLEGLREKSLVWIVRGGRALKYEHRITDQLKLAGPELAVMCVLMLRGPQTAGEIRGRTGRLHEFASLEEVDRVLEALMSAEPPRATKLPRSPGTKEPRYAHLLSGETRGEEREAAPRMAPVTPEAPHDDDRVGKLERETEALRRELHELRQELIDLKSRVEVREDASAER